MVKIIMSSNLTLPAFKGSTVAVSILNSGTFSIRADFLVHNPLPGHDAITCPCYSFLIENKKLGKKVLYDLGLIKDTTKLPPSSKHCALKMWLPSRVLMKTTVLAQIDAAGAVMHVEKDVADQLTQANVPLESINSIIWSHHHLDHIGDPSLFPKSTSLVVGPGFKNEKTTFPGYPENPDAVIPGDGFEGRELVELDFSSDLSIGGYPAIDFFDDGSLYILQAPGHSKYTFPLTVPSNTKNSRRPHLCSCSYLRRQIHLFRWRCRTPPRGISPNPSSSASGRDQAISIPRAQVSISLCRCHI